MLNDRSGISVSGAGDVNGDGFDDVIIGASNAANQFREPGIIQGQGYVVFGRSGGFGPRPWLCRSLNGTNGFLPRPASI